ncbi:hypothetical protein ANN_11752 [Periplaneta americana]|uniref:Uncharacterized protein n=1 Tax=Periplaneta americana TaxID=6978 RepID=A0ABQ8T7Q1_PERAM|nr:hypothetical protein ANN_11752 [Periplaneta americana]
MKGKERQTAKWNIEKLLVNVRYEHAVVSEGINPEVIEHNFTIIEGLRAVVNYIEAQISDYIKVNDIRASEKINTFASANISQFRRDPFYFLLLLLSSETSYIQIVLLVLQDIARLSNKNVSSFFARFEKHSQTKLLVIQGFTAIVKAVRTSLPLNQRMKRKGDNLMFIQKKVTVKIVNSVDIVRCKIRCFTLNLKVFNVGQPLTSGDNEFQERTVYTAKDEEYAEFLKKKNSSQYVFPNSSHSCHYRRYDFFAFLAIQRSKRLATESTRNNRLCRYYFTSLLESPSQQCKMGKRIREFSVWKRNMWFRCGSTNGHIPDKQKTSLFQRSELWNHLLQKIELELILKLIFEVISALWRLIKPGLKSCMILMVFPECGHSWIHMEATSFSSTLKTLIFALLSCTCGMTENYPYYFMSYIIYHISHKSYRIVSYHIVSYRIVSYRIVSYRIVSYRIVSYRIVSYRIKIPTKVMNYLHAVLIRCYGGVTSMVATLLMLGYEVTVYIQLHHLLKIKENCMSSTHSIVISSYAYCTATYAVSARRLNSLNTRYISRYIQCDKNAKPSHDIGDLRSLIRLTPYVDEIIGDHQCGYISFLSIRMT